MTSDPLFYAAAIPAMIVLGLAKGGFNALGLLVVPIMALVISPVQAAAIALPILVLTDIVAVISYWGVFDIVTLAIMLPGAMIGVAIGWMTAAQVSEQEIRLIVGVVSMLFALNHWLRARTRRDVHAASVVKGSFWGLVCGFTSFVSHAGGPPYQMYAVPLRLDPRVFVGTSVLLFAVINAAKVGPYFLLGQFDTTNLVSSAILVPVAIPSTFLGVWLVKKFDTEAFYQLVYALVFLIGLYLVGEALL